MNMKSELFIHWKAKERSYIVGGRTARRSSLLAGVAGRVRTAAGLAAWRPV